MRGGINDPVYDVCGAATVENGGRGGRCAS
jgi:hypothetical protein